MQYSDPIISKVIEIIKAKNGEIKHFYQSEPVRFAASELPCIAISKSNTDAAHFSNTQDQHSVGLTLTLIVDVRDEITTETDAQRLVAGVSKLYEIMEGRDSNFKLKDTSLLNILRTNTELGNNLRIQLEGAMRVNYGEALRRKNPELWTVEAQINFDCHFVQER